MCDILGECRTPLCFLPTFLKFLDPDRSKFLIPSILQTLVYPASLIRSPVFFQNFNGRSHRAAILWFVGKFPLIHPPRLHQSPIATESNFCWSVTLIPPVLHPSSVPLVCARCTPSIPVSAWLLNPLLGLRSTLKPADLLQAFLVRLSCLAPLLVVRSLWVKAPFVLSLLTTCSTKSLATMFPWLCLLVTWLTHQGVLLTPQWTLVFILPFLQWLCLWTLCHALYLLILLPRRTVHPPLVDPSKLCLLSTKMAIALINRAPGTQTTMELGMP
jgi:hypothetical protein